eukprot:TRINITY_DN1663_c0_g1_i1.p1 TRINITY_DN1663_c0_g1~~TRINITY_DN1663_c0_g1_i1.p1  ORF type:complete len:675 (-),score=137.88 TRINITY_DN1663_c0_g1_i1:100-2124(-)
MWTSDKTSTDGRVVSLYVSTENTIKQGWLLKTGDVVRSIKKRFFILEKEPDGSATLHYYDPSLEPKGSIPLSTVFDAKPFQTPPSFLDTSCLLPSIWGGGTASSNSPPTNVSPSSLPVIDPSMPSTTTTTTPTTNTSSLSSSSSSNNSNSSFVLLTDTRVYTLQAPSQTEQQEWLKVIRQYMGQAIIMSGWLTKIAGDLLKSTKRRWFVLTSESFRYFENDHQQQQQQLPLGVIKLTQIMKVRAVDDKKLNPANEPMFAIETKLNSRIYYLVADSIDEMNHWIKKLIQESFVLSVRKSIIQDEGTPLLSRSGGSVSINISSNSNIGEEFTPPPSPILSPLPLATLSETSSTMSPPKSSKKAKSWTGANPSTLTDNDSTGIIDVNSVAKEKELGKGIWLGVYQDKQVVVKDYSKYERFSAINFKQSLKQFQSLNSQFIAKIYGGYLRPCPCLVVQYCPRGDLSSLLKQNNETYMFGWKELYTIAVGIARGLLYLHYRCSPPIVHSHLKPTNILIGDDGRIKLTDFSLRSNLIGSSFNPYLSPEVASSYSITSASDVYSFAIILWEMIHRVVYDKYEMAYSNFREERSDFKSTYAFVMQVLRGERPPLPSEGVPEELLSLLSSCWETNPTERITSAQLLGRLVSLRDEVTRPSSSSSMTIVSEANWLEDEPTQSIR